MLFSLTVIGASIPSLSTAADDIAKVFTESCLSCHSKVRPLDNMHLAKEQWSETIDRMIDQGAEVPKGRKAELAEYLFRTHGPVGETTGGGKK
jgi:hypothetical protein